jgi:hypothetical protein
VGQRDVSADATRAARARQAAGAARGAGRAGRGGARTKARAHACANSLHSLASVGVQSQLPAAAVVVFVRGIGHRFE